MLIAQEDISPREIDASLIYLGVECLEQPSLERALDGLLSSAQSFECLLVDLLDVARR